MIQVDEVKIPTFLQNLLNFKDYTDYIAVLSLNGPVISPIYYMLFILIFPLISLVFPNTMQLINFVSYQGKWSFKTNLLSATFLALILFVSFLTFTGNVSQGEFIYFNF